MPSSRTRWPRTSAGPTTASAVCARFAERETAPLTCAALKPQGLPPEELGALAGKLAAGGIDFIKDDHGLADQTYSRFAGARPGLRGAVCHASDDTGLLTSYVPNISGDLNLAAAQIGLAMEEGLEAVMVEPMILGLSNFNRLVREFPGHGILRASDHGGRRADRAAALLGKLFRMFGADAIIFPNHGGRFGYSPETCRASRTKRGALAGAASAPCRCRPAA